ncbi:glycosyltransferase family 39 protein [Pedobacter frigiditerrae]|nr:glycosyltransferase family 39 protein [Pedobacter frigiditerrae]
MNTFFRKGTGFFKNLPLFIILIFILSLCIIFIKPGHNWGDDFALYINQAKAITDGTIAIVKQNNQFSIDNSTIHTFSPTLAPWGWPIILSPFYYLFGLNIFVFKLLKCLFLVLFLYQFYRLINRRLDKTSSSLIVLYLGTSFRYIDNVNVVLTETPFLFFVTLSLNSIHNYKYEKYNLIKSIFLGLAIYFSFCIRSEGAMLGVALFFWQVRESFQYKSLKKPSMDYLKWLVMPYIIFISFYLLISSLLPSGFLSHFNDSHLVSVNHTLKAITFYIDKIRDMIYPGMNNFTYILITILFLIGLVTNFMKEIHTAIYLLLITITFLFWPFLEYRYLLMFFPFLIYFLALGVSYFDVFKSKLQPIHLVFVILILLNFYKIYSILDENKLTKQIGPENASSTEMFHFIKTNTKEKDVIIFFRPRAMTLYTGRQSAMIYRNWNDLLKIGDYLVLRRNLATYFQFPANKINALGFKDNLQYVYQNEEFIVFKIKKL